LLADLHDTAVSIASTRVPSPRDLGGRAQLGTAPGSLPWSRSSRGPFEHLFAIDANTIRLRRIPPETHHSATFGRARGETSSLPRTVAEEGGEFEMRLQKWSPVRKKEGNNSTIGLEARGTSVKGWWRSAIVVLAARQVAGSGQSGSDNDGPSAARRGDGNQPFRSRESRPPGYQTLPSR